MATVDNLPLSNTFGSSSVEDIQFGFGSVTQNTQAPLTTQAAEDTLANQITQITQISPANAREFEEKVSESINSFFDFDARLLFTYGTMGSAKSALAILLERYLKEQHSDFVIEPIVLKPEIDTRWGSSTTIKSRTGLSTSCIAFTSKFEFTYENILSFIDFVDLSDPRSYTVALIIDEAQFLTVDQVNQLRLLVAKYDIPVYCFGLLTNFKGELFSGAQRLIELSDETIHLQNLCSVCGEAPSLINARFVPSSQEPILATEGEEVVIGGDDCYRALCYRCYLTFLRRAKVVKASEEEEDEEGGEER